MAQTTTFDNVKISGHKFSSRLLLKCQQCLPSSSVQSYRVNIAKSTMTMTRKTRYNAPPLVTTKGLFYQICKIRIKIFMKML